MTTDDIFIAVDSLCSTDITKLSIDIKLRRGLKNAGYGTLAAAFDASDTELELVLNWNQVDELNRLKVLMIEHPNEFVSKMQPNISQKEIRELADYEPQSQKKVEQKRTTTAPLKRRAMDDSSPFTTAEELERLGRLEESARLSVLLLSDSLSSSILADVFSPLGSKLDEIHDCYVTLFHRYSHCPNQLLNYIPSEFRYSFLVFVADLARRDHDGETLWKNVFSGLGFPADWNAQARFKRIFYSQIKRIGLACYTREEDGCYYLYTALLHGGFSESFWQSLWSTTILPLARRLDRGVVTSRDAVELLKSACDKQDGRADANMFVIRILRKAPRSTVLPLFTAALQVGMRVIQTEKSSGLVELFSGFGLPDTALIALKHVLTAQSKRRYLYLPQAELRLVPAEGRVLLHWDEQRYPMDFQDLSIRYYVNGQLEKCSNFRPDINRLVLDECNIEIAPNTQFDIEIALVDVEGDKVIANMRQSFDRTRPGSFEFIEDRDRIFRLRKASAIFNSDKTIAFLTKEDFRVEPVFGMNPLEEYDGDGKWLGASIQLFRVSPGAAGSLVNRRTNLIVASWQEDYFVEIDRRNVIGKGQGGCDLYGFIPNTRGTNDALPFVVIETLDGRAIKDDIEIVCVCDSERISLQRKVFEPDYELDPFGKVRLCIDMRETDRISWAVSEGLLQIRQKSSGRTILLYRFSIVPIQSFKLIDLLLNDDGCTAVYELSASEVVEVEDDGCTWELCKDETYEFESSLSANWREMTITSVSNDLKILVRFNLAAIELVLSKSFFAASRSRVLALSDCSQLDGRITVSSMGKRNSRIAYALVGTHPVFFAAMTGNGEYRFDLLANKEPFRGKTFEDQPFQIIFCMNYGFDSRPNGMREYPVDLILANCVAGQGLGAISIRTRKEGMCLSFSRQSETGYEFKFIDRRGKLLGAVSIDDGEKYVLIPQEAAYQLRTKRSVSVTVTPLSLFGVPEAEDAVTVKLGQ